MIHGIMRKQICVDDFSLKKNGTKYANNISRLYGIICYLAFAQSLVFTIFAWLIIGVLYGDAYGAAVPILQVLIWQCAFSYMGTIRNIWLLAEEKQKYLPIINLSGVVANIILNAVMIPFWGAFGAAFASLLTQFAMNFLFGFILKPIRENNRLLLRGLNPAFFAKEMKSIVKELLKKDNLHRVDANEEER